VVRVKNRLSAAWWNFRYWKRKSGTALSSSQKKAIPPASSVARCAEGIVVK
jgi:hypothetical protein